MAITNTDGLIAAMASGQRIALQKSSVTTVASFYTTLWDVTGIPGAGALAINNNTSGVIPTDATAGAPIIRAFTPGNTGYLLSFDASTAQPGVVSMYDRLWHAGTFTAGSLQTYTLSGQPGLQRVPNNDYSQLELWMEVTTASGATSTTVTVGYTDGAGVARSATLDANLSSAPVRRMLPFRLANSTGIKWVNSVTIGGATGTVAFNLVIQRNIVDHTVVSANIGRPRKDAFDTGMPIIYEDSCLALMFLATTTSSGALFAEAVIGNG